MNNELMKLVEKMVMEQAELYAEKLNEQAEDGVPLGMKEPNAEQHRVWFESMVARDPAWVLALPFVEGGKKELARYKRTIGEVR